MRFWCAKVTWWTFRIFFIFSARGGGRESPRRREGGGGEVLLKIPGGGGLQDGRGRGAGRVSVANWGIFWGGEAKYFFFRGRNVHQG